jgi:hypothetical protein
VIEAFESLQAIAWYLKDKKINISYSKVQAIYNNKAKHDFLKIKFIND